MLAFNQQSEPIVGEYFIGSDDLTFGNLFQPQKINSISESEIGLGLSLGVNYDLKFRSNEEFNFKFGAGYIEDASYTMGPNSSLKPEEIGYLASFSTQNLILSLTSNFSHDMLRLIN